MRSDDFKAWLADQGQASASISTRISDARRVESLYGDLDRAFEDDRLEAIFAELAYSKADEANGRPNPSRIEIDGNVYNSLASYRAAVTAYLKFRDGNDLGDPTQADRIRRFALETIVKPARDRGEVEVEIVAGDIHKAMSLQNAMPAVCSAIGSSKFNDFANVKLIDRQGPANSSTVRFRFGLDSPPAQSWAAAELRRRFGAPTLDTEKMAAFDLPDGRQIALQRDTKTVQIWLEDGDSPSPIPAAQVRHYLAEQPRHSNLPARLSHVARAGQSPRRVSLVQTPDLKTLGAVLDWYEGQPVSGVDRLALAHYRRLFEARYPDFVDFEQSGGGYAEEERHYKDKLISLARAATIEPESVEKAGGQLLDILVGRGGAASNLLGYRTNIRIAEIRSAFPDKLELAIGQLAGADDISAAISDCVEQLWPILSEGQASKPYSESRNIPTMIAALLRPTEAYGVNTEPLQNSAKALVGHKLFGWNAMTADEYREALSMARMIEDVMRDEWNWKPRDLWDVQGFIWAVNRADQPTLSHEEDGVPASRKDNAMPTNLILYGPPGTGKTFATAREAVRLCDGEAPESEIDMRARYAELAGAGQIRFVTFHQSYSYEDFVEGLRPTTGGDGQENATGGFSLQPTPGIFREIATVAEQAMRSSEADEPVDMSGRRVFKMSLGRAGSEDHIFDAAIEGDYIVLGWGGDIDWSPFEDYDAIHAKWNEIHPGTNGNDPNIAQTARFRASMREGDLVVVSFGNNRFRAIAEVTGPYEYNPTGEQDYNHRRAVRWLFVADEPLPISFYSRPFMQWSCYLLNEDHLNREALALFLPGSGRSALEPAQFVLICDEINRANISKVFGELITLIEPDKRIGAPYELRVTLPYSKHSFGVPSNLHIIGTMNTADRSIALLDTALRRRFVFREIMPEPELLSHVEDVDLALLLRRLNDRIEYLFDREHQIGHAFLIGCRSRAELDEIFRFRIIPLLAEYFHEDWAKIAAALGDAAGERFLVRELLTAPPGIEAEYGGERYRWRVRDSFVADAYAGLQ